MTTEMTETETPNGTSPDNAPAVTVAPRVDIYENDRGFLVVTDLPGVAADDVRVEYEQDQLRLEAKRRYEPTPNDGVHHEYARSFRLAGIDPDGIEAELKDGVLHLTLPKTPERQPRQIPVTVQ